MPKRHLRFSIKKWSTALALCQAETPSPPNPPLEGEGFTTALPEIPAGYESLLHLFQRFQNETRKSQGRRSRRHAGRRQPRSQPRGPRRRHCVYPAACAGGLEQRRAAAQCAVRTAQRSRGRGRTRHAQRRVRARSGAACRTAAACLRVRRRQRLPAARRARTQGAQCRGARLVLRRSTDVSGDQRGLLRPARCGGRAERSLRHRPGSRDRRHHRRRGHGRHARAGGCAISSWSASSTT